MQYRKKLLIASLAFIACLFMWIWIFSSTKPATPSNTYEVQINISAVNSNLAYHRGTDLLFITTAEDQFILDTMWRNEEKTEELARQIRSTEGPVTVCVLEHIPRYPLRSGVWCKQIVTVCDLSSDLVSLSEYNSEQKTERVFGVIIGFFVFVLLVLFESFLLADDLKKRIRRAKKRIRRAKKRQSGQGNQGKQSRDGSVTD